MNLYVRMLWVIAKALRAPKMDALESFELRLRVLPNDLDINGHMNNARYLALVDLALVTLFIRTGFSKLCLQRKWRPMSGGSVLHFRRGLGPFEAFTLRFTPLSWDRYWNYNRFEFIRNGQVYVSGFMKGAAVGKDGLVPTSEMYEALGQHVTAPPFPEDLAAWIASDALLGAQIRRSNGNARVASV